ncbi:hypothetical protein [Rubneribacter sp.]|nr:hypothetical protein [Candidatus Rubneribacter avistercoris]
MERDFRSIREHALAAIDELAGADADELLDAVGEALGNPSMPPADTLHALIDLPSPLYDRKAADGEEICDVRWVRDDVVAAYEHCQGVRLGRGDAVVEDYIDAVVSDIGDTLQDRSTEFGYELIYDFLPDFDTFARESVAAAEKEPSARNARAAEAAARASSHLDGARAHAASATRRLS